MAKQALVIPEPVMQFCDSAGVPLAGGLVYTYAAGTSTPLSSYTDSALLVPNSNPVVLDTSGRAKIYLDALNYKIDVQSSLGVSQSGYPADNIAGSMWSGAVKYNWPATDGASGQLLQTDGATNLSWGGSRYVVNGRLTLTSGTPITVSDVTAATTIFFTPYLGDLLSAYTGTSWNTRVFTELSIGIPAVANQMYDVFVFDNAGVWTLEVLAWTNDTTRATALVVQNGMLVKSGATTRLFLGCCRTTTVAGQTEDSATKRYVWNYFNRDRRPLLRRETTASWSYTTATWRQANGAAANQVDVIVGYQEATLDLLVVVSPANATAGTVVGVGIGEDSTTTPHASLIGAIAVASSNGNPGQITAWLKIKPAVGRHFYAWLEYSTAVGTSSWFGTNILSNISGLFGAIEG